MQPPSRSSRSSSSIFPKLKHRFRAAEFSMRLLTLLVGTWEPGMRRHRCSFVSMGSRLLNLKLQGFLHIHASIAILVDCLRSVLKGAFDVGKGIIKFEHMQ